MNEIADMRKLLSDVGDADAREYLKEALVCYEAGAFRACIVMTANAVFENLIRRVTDFAEYDTPAKTLKVRIDTDLASQRSFEGHMIGELHKANFLTIDQKVGLVKIRDARNKAAHPSRVKSTPEEARAVFRIAIEEFIKPEWLTAAEGSRRLLYEMQCGSVFPEEGDDVEVVDEKLGQIDKTAHAKLIVDLWGELEQPTNDAFTRNAQRFLNAFAGKQDGRFRKQFTKLLAPKKPDPLVTAARDGGGTSNKRDDRWLPFLISADPFLLTVVNGSARKLLDERIAKIFLQPLSGEDAAIDATERYISAIALSPHREAIVESYPKAMKAAVNTVGLRAVLLGCLDKADSLKDHVLVPVFDAWNHGSSALLVAEALPDIDEKLANSLSAERAFDLVVSLCSFSRQVKEPALSDLVGSGFADAPALRTKAISFMNEQPDATMETLKHHVLCGPLELVETFLTPRRRPSFVRKRVTR
ncbi:hypothetical protein RHECIAT_CH0003296 [Rhizobium etli CIAT 652]|uniref:DUF4145 domain-containing protein n=1 Tax=Rhizobium etli (strain CIAT 652) TaxID=491916 RepID=B3PVM4_RHIE6|nr:hypothetical protein RHECIAT_CH0003296 [Rhizobium etli CIAT 652]